MMHLDEAKIQHFMQLSYQYTETMIDLKRPLDNGVSFSDVFASILNSNQDEFKIENDLYDNSGNDGYGFSSQETFSDISSEKYERDFEKAPVENEKHKPEKPAYAEKENSAEKRSEDIKTSDKEEARALKENETEKEISVVEEKRPDSETLLEKSGLSDEEKAELKELLAKLKKFVPDIDKLLAAIKDAEAKWGLKELKIKFTELKAAIVKVSEKDELKEFNSEIMAELKELLEEMKKMILLMEDINSKALKQSAELNSKAADFNRKAAEFLNSLKNFIEEQEQFNEKEKNLKKGRFKIDAEAEKFFEGAKEKEEFFSKAGLERGSEDKNLGVYYKISQTALKKNKDLKKQIALDKNFKESLKTADEETKPKLKPVSVKEELKKDFFDLKQFTDRKEPEQKEEVSSKTEEKDLRSFFGGQMKASSAEPKPEKGGFEIKEFKNPDIVQTEGLKAKGEAAKDFAAVKANFTPRGQELISNVIKQIEVMVKADKTEATVRLKPDHLGEMKIKLSLEDGRMFLRFTVTNQAVKEVIETNLQQLKDSLQHLGFSLENFSVDVGSGEAKKEQDASGRKGGTKGKTGGLNYEPIEEESFERIKISRYDYVA